MINDNDLGKLKAMFYQRSLDELEQIGDILLEIIQKKTDEINKNGGLKL